MNLVYIGEELAMQLPVLIKPFQEQASGKQFSWIDVSAMACLEEVNIRPATPSELAVVAQHFELMNASLAYLGQFVSDEVQ